MAAVKAILFDLDDTLWPINPIIDRAERIMYAWMEQHIPATACLVSIESMRARRQALMQSDPIYQIDLRRLRHAVLMHACAESGDDPAMADKALEVFSTARNEVAPFRDVLLSLAVLKERYLLGSVTNGVADLDAIGIAHFFQISVAAYQLGVAKPDPSIFHLACERLHITPAEAVYVGDDPVLDVQGAQGIGMRAVWMRRPSLPSKALPPEIRPDAICADLTELQDWLAELESKEID